MRIGALQAAFAAGVILAVAGPGSAAITRYECRFDQPEARGDGWIPEMLALTENDATGKILVNDPVIQYFVGRPIPASLSRQTNVRKTFQWAVDAEVRGQSPRMFYTFSDFNNGQAAQMKAMPGGYDNVWSSEGRCTVSKG